MKPRPAKTRSTVSAERVQMEFRSRFNPIRGLTPAVLSSHLDQFDAGYLRGMAILMSKIEDRCDKLKSLASKRAAAAARLDWDVITRADAPAAAARLQREALLEFLHGIEATNVVDEDDRGDFSLLTRQMMAAVGMRYSVHEIVWKPRPAGMRAELRQVPLWYFEHTTPRLRYLASDGAIAGAPLEPAGWLVTRGPGLHVAGSILYMYASMSLKDWVNYNRRYAVPGLHGSTTAAKGSTEWTNLSAALARFGQDFALVTGADAKVETLDVSAHGNLPFGDMVERCERAMSILWRGADLSTMSKDDAVGASVQADETALLTGDDLAMLESYIARGLTPHVIRYVTGDTDVHVELRYTQNKNRDTKVEIEVDRFLIDAGAPVSTEDLLERYGRQQPPPDAVLASKSPTSVTPTVEQTNELTATAPAAAEALDAARSARLREAAREALGRAMAADLAPLRARIEAALDIADDAAMQAALLALAGEMPDLLTAAPPTASQQVLEETIAAALVNGIAAGAARRPAIATPEKTP